MLMIVISMMMMTMIDGTISGVAFTSNVSLQQSNDDLC